MSLRLRILLLLALAGGLAAGWSWIRPPVAKTKDQTIRWQSSAQCKACHEEVYAQWHGSHHQIAYSNPRVRDLSEDFRIKDCQACHLPQPVAMTGFEKRTLPRQTRPEEGVGCLACHLSRSGGIMAVRDRPEAPCKPQRHADFDSVALCASCHNQHQTTDQWRQSPYATEKAKKVCNDCHMQGRGGGHIFRAAHDLEMLQAAGKFEAKVVAGELVLSLRNTGAGHNFPTEERHRAVDILYRFTLRDGSQGNWEQAYRFRQPYRDEPGENTQLPAGEEKTVRVAVPENASVAEARLWYRLNPYAQDGDADSNLLYSRELKLQ